MKTVQINLLGLSGVTFLASMMGNKLETKCAAGFLVRRVC